MTFDMEFDTDAARVLALEKHLLARSEGEKEYSCQHCRHSTKWWDFSWGVAVPTCSTECQNAMWRNYFEGTTETFSADDLSDLMSSLGI